VEQLNNVIHDCMTEVVCETKVPPQANFHYDENQGKLGPAMTTFGIKPTISTYSCQKIEVTQTPALVYLP